MVPSDQGRVFGNEIHARRRFDDVRPPGEGVDPSEDEQDAKRAGHRRSEPHSRRGGSARMDAMARRRMWWVAIALGAALIGFALWIPGYRLDREIAAARREGLWTETADILRHTSSVPEGENAAPLIRKAITITPREDPKTDKAIGDFLRGKATAAQVALVRRNNARHPEITAAWRLASTRPQVNYGRNWEEGSATLFPEFQNLKRGVKRLAVAARLGDRPRENLLAAARLADLTRQEPVILSTLVSASIGWITLREARHLGLGREVEAALGPPLDVRRMYAAELVFSLDYMRNDGTDDWNRRMGLKFGPSLLTRLTHAEPRRSNETAALVHDWRAMWRELGSGTDYPTAARAIRRQMPGINDRLANWSEIYAMFNPDTDDIAAKFPLALQKYADERRKARESGP